MLIDVPRFLRFLHSLRSVEMTRGVGTLVEMTGGRTRSTVRNAKGQGEALFEMPGERRRIDRDNTAAIVMSSVVETSGCER